MDTRKSQTHTKRSHHDSATIIYKRAASSCSNINGKRHDVFSSSYATSHAYDSATGYDISSFSAHDIPTHSF